MRTSFNNLKVKKGDKVFIVADWNNFKNGVSQFSLTEWTILASGKIQTYLTSDKGHSKRSFPSNHEFCIILASETNIIELAKIDCQTIRQESLERAKEGVKWAEEKNWELSYIKTRKETVKAIETNPLELIYFEQYFMTGESKIKEIIKFQ